MASYSPDQILAIRRAIAEGRAAVSGHGHRDLLRFAAAYVAHGGIQVPGQPEDQKARDAIARRLMAILESTATAEDPSVMRELARVKMETQWANAARLPKVVGFRLQLGPEALRRTECLALLAVDRGLGAAVFGKTEVVVLPPGCEDCEFIPVMEDEVEQ